MAHIDDLVDARELTGFTRDVIDNYDKYQGDSLSPLMPIQEQDTLDYKYKTQVTKVHEAAKFRAWDAAAPIVARPTTTTEVQGTLPPMTIKSFLSEKDATVLDGQEDDVRDAVFANAEYLAQGIVDRFELQRGEALNTDSVTISENGIILPAISFNRDAGNDKTPAALWDIVTTDILGDLKQWQKDHPLVDYWMISTDIWFDMLAADQFRDIVRGDVSAASAALVSDDQLRTVLTAFGVKPFVLYDREIVTTDDDGDNRTQARVTPANRIYGLPNQSIGNVFLGPTQDAAVVGLTGADAPGVTATGMIDFDPVHRWVKASAAGLTVLGRSDDVVTATVIT